MRTSGNSTQHIRFYINCLKKINIQKNNHTERHQIQAITIKAITRHAGIFLRDSRYLCVRFGSIEIDMKINAGITINKMQSVAYFPVVICASIFFPQK